VLEPGPNVLPLRFGNGVKGRTYGAELSAAYRLVSWWRFAAGYHLFEEETFAQTRSHDGNAGSAESDDPHTSIYSIHDEYSGGIEFGVVFRYCGCPAETYVSRIPVWMSGWDGHHESPGLNIVGQNLLSGQHAELYLHHFSAQN